jgi:transcriptional regulator with XRE-family HTH domain
VDPIRFGRGIRVLRQRRGWRQEDLAAAAGLSQPVISRIELGDLDSIPVGKVARAARAVGAGVDLRLSWQGEGLDRLIDSAHAALVEQVVRIMTTRGWDAVTEATFNVFGERGSVDVLARQVQWRRLALVEVKSTIGDVQATLAALDRKLRNAPTIARDRGWAPWPASRLLVVADTSTARRRVLEHGATFDSVMPCESRAVRRWLSAPEATVIGGVWFLSPTRRTGVRRRIQAPRAGIAARHPPDG